MKNERIVVLLCILAAFFAILVFSRLGGENAGAGAAPGRVYFDGNRRAPPPIPAVPTIE